MGHWDGDNWVHIMCPLVATIGLPHAPHDVNLDDDDEWDE